MPGIRTVAAPPGGLFRVGRQPDPLVLHEPTAVDLTDHRAGNRFDSFLGNFRVLYFATELETCFEETLSRLMPRPGLADLVRDEWSQMNFMNPGSVAREWRNDRRIARVTIDPSEQFVDVDNVDTLARLERILSPILGPLDVTNLDTATIRGWDRRVTRWIAQHIWTIEDDQGFAAFAGIRYASRVNGKECWAVFDRTPVMLQDVGVIYASNPDLVTVATRRGLTIH